MSVTIRLAKIGKKNAPAFKIVATNTRAKRNGRYLDILGHYNPSTNPVDFKLDKEKYQDWIRKGALTTAAVSALKNGTYEFKPYKRGTEVAEEKVKESPTETETTVEKEQHAANDAPEEAPTEEQTEKIVEEVTEATQA